MPEFKMLWIDASKAQFEQLRQRAANTGRSSEFVAAHNQIAQILQDVEKAIEKGDPLYHTKKPGGVCYHLLVRFISVTYIVFEEEKVGWILKYLAVPPSWPDNNISGGRNGKHEYE
jgi:hypothetical protein